MPTLVERFRPFAERMRQARMHDLEIKTFEAYYRQLVEGQTGLIPEADIQPIDTLPDAETLPADLVEAGRTALPKTILLKLNGGLGTSMGLEKAKSLLVVKNGLSFLDIIAHQALRAGIPLVLMNSAHTDEDSLQALRKYPGLQRDIPLSFKQSEFLKIIQDDFRPAEWPQNPQLEWYPPGHGNLYLSLRISGMLDTLIQAGYEYAFVSNSDNLGAVIEPTILGYFAQNRYPFMMEVANRTEADKKGGHLARRADGRLILRESAQCPTEDMAAFQDVGRHKFFNTNNIWLNLHALQRMLTTAQDTMDFLPMIRNPKTIDPRDSRSTPVYQLETAMGSAIVVFEGAQALRVPRTRFAPVKTTSDLLAVRSDTYRLTEDYHVVPDPGDVVVDLDSAWYKLIDAMEARFPEGPPSLRDCRSLRIKGDVAFGAGVTCRGHVQLMNETEAQVAIESGSIIEGERRWS